MSNLNNLSRPSSTPIPAFLPMADVSVIHESEHRSSTQKWNTCFKIQMHNSDSKCLHSEAGTTCTMATEAGVTFFMAKRDGNMKLISKLLSIMKMN